MFEILEDDPRASKGEINYRQWLHGCQWMLRSSVGSWRQGDTLPRVSRLSECLMREAPAALCLDALPFQAYLKSEELWEI